MISYVLLNSVTAGTKINLSIISWSVLNGRGFY